MGARPHLHPDAVDVVGELGDRTDRLERRRGIGSSAETSATTTRAWWWNLSIPGNGSNHAIGTIVFPVGLSRLIVAGSWQTAGEATLEDSSLGGEHDPGSSTFLGGFETMMSPVGAGLFGVSVVGLIRCSRRVSVPYIVEATTSDGSAVAAQGMITVDSLAPAP